MNGFICINLEKNWEFIWSKQTNRVFPITWWVTYTKEYLKATVISNHFSNCVLEVPISDTQELSQVQKKIKTAMKLFTDQTGCPINILEKLSLKIDGEKELCFIPIYKNERHKSIIGAKEFCNLLDSIEKAVHKVDVRQLRDIIVRNNYLFSINDGDGLSFYLETFVKALKQNDLLYRDRFIEVQLKEDDSIHSQVDVALNKAGIHQPGLICFDCASFLIEQTNDTTIAMLDYVNQYDKNILFIFRIPLVETRRLQEIEGILGDRMGLRSLTFVPPTNAELYQFAKQCLERNKMPYEDVEQAFYKLLANERRDGRFYGYRTVEKLIDELVYSAIIESDDSALVPINNQMVEAQITYDQPEIGDLSLDTMIGMETIHNTINEIIVSIQYAKDNSVLQTPCLHMMFCGNPGCGKTTVARLYGQILKREGILSIGNFYEVSGRDLVGKHIGETTPKTAQLCRDAYGSVLFIDEAYTLASDEEDMRDYGKEALATLISEMENNRDNFVVILAGYTDQMDALLRTNVGLRDRISHTINFKNYTHEQLCNIFFQMVQNHFTYDDLFEKRARDFFYSIEDEYYNDKMFSNARMVRNFYERVWSKASVRFQMNEMSGSSRLLAIDVENAINDGDFATLLKKKKTHRIGH